IVTSLFGSSGNVRVRSGSTTALEAALPRSALELAAASSEPIAMSSIFESLMCTSMRPAQLSGACRQRPRPVIAGGFGECDREPVPAIDLNDAQGQDDELLLAEEPTCALVHLIRHLLALEPCDSFRPLECCTLAVRVHRRFAPRGQQVKTLLRLSREAGILRLHVDAETATIELRPAHLDEVQERMIELGAHSRAQIEHCAERFAMANGIELNSCSHAVLQKRRWPRMRRFHLEDAAPCDSVTRPANERSLSGFAIV